MKRYLTRYTLSNGTRGALHVIAHSSWAAIDTVFATFPDQVRVCSARPA